MKIGHTFKMEISAIWKIGNSRRKGCIIVKKLRKKTVSFKKITRGFQFKFYFSENKFNICFCESRTIKMLINHKLGALDQRTFLIYVYSLFKIIDWNDLTVQCHFNSLVILVSIANTIFWITRYAPDDDSRIQSP